MLDESDNLARKVAYAKGKNDMAQAMSTDALEDTLAYIARCEDIKLSVEIKEQ